MVKILKGKMKLVKMMTMILISVTQTMLSLTSVRPALGLLQSSSWKAFTSRSSTSWRQFF